jgi:hypothetical protein
VSARAYPSAARRHQGTSADDERRTPATSRWRTSWWSGCYFLTLILSVSLLALKAPVGTNVTLSV